MFILDRNSPRSLQVKLYDEIKNQILSGKLAPDTRLPSIRHLSADLSISCNTVEYAYEQLCTEGFIYSRPRSGYYVSLLDQEFIPRSSRKDVNQLAQALEYGTKALFDFHPAALSPDSFPSKVWRKLINNCLQENTERFTLYGNPQGEIELRHEIQQYLERFRGVSCGSEQIVVCCGLQDSLSSIAQMLRTSHSTLAVEEPGHWLPRSVFRNYSFSLDAIPVNSDGINLEYLISTNSTVVYVTPSHQFPLGAVMPMENRLKLINWAEKVGGVIIEDDYDSELRYHGKPIPALQGLHPKGNIIYVGTFSKVLSPALRVSYMVLPYQFLDIYSRLFVNYANPVSLLEQGTLQKFMKQGYWERHLRKMRTIYKRKHDALVESLNRHFGQRVNILGQGAGLHIVVELIDNPFTENELIKRALENNIRLIPIAEAYQSDNKQPPKVMLGFGRMNLNELEAGVKMLSEAWNLYR